MTGVIPIGGSVRLMELSELARAFKCSIETITSDLARLKVPILPFGGRSNVNLPALEIALFRAHLPDDVKTGLSHNANALLQTMTSMEWGTLDVRGLRDRLTKWLRALTHEREYGKFQLDKKERDLAKKRRAKNALL